MAQMDLFGMLGLAPAEEKKETKKETTKKGSGKKSTSKSGGTTTSDTFKVGTEGITLISGYYPEKTLSLSDLDKELEDGQEEVEITASELVKAAIKNGLESFIEGHTKTAKLKSGKILLASDGIKMNESKDGFSGEWRILLGGYETTVSGEKFTCKEVQETWYASYPEHTDLTDFQFDEARKVFVPFFKQQKMKETKNGTVTIWGQTPYPFENKKASEAAKETYTEQLEENYHIVPYEEDKFFVVPYLKTGTAAVKETTYPTKDVVLSLVFTKIPLSPDMFGGKEEVNEKELLKFICADYPEYGSGRASVQYLKK